MKKNVYSVVLGVSMLLFWGCSSDSAGSVNPENPINSKTSTCALVNNYLPASSILYSDDGRGGVLRQDKVFLMMNIWPMMQLWLPWDLVNLMYLWALRVILNPSKMLVL